MRSLVNPVAGQRALAGLPALVDRGRGTTAPRTPASASCELEPDGRMPMHLHSFEESFHVLDGTAVVQTAEASVVLGPGDYGVIPVGVRHTWSNEGDATVRWAEMQGPQPRKRFGEDTFVVSAPPAPHRSSPRPAVQGTRSFGNITRDHMDVTKAEPARLLPVSRACAPPCWSMAIITINIHSIRGSADDDVRGPVRPDGVVGPRPPIRGLLILEGTSTPGVRRRAQTHCGDCLGRGSAAPHLREPC
jgi:mannose-6-phosphate isomerase-like protein (cupin superfamily)